MSFDGNVSQPLTACSYENSFIRKSFFNYSHQRFLQLQAMILIEFSINVDRETGKEHEQTDSN